MKLGPKGCVIITAQIVSQTLQYRSGGYAGVVTGAGLTAGQHEDARVVVAQTQLTQRPPHLIHRAGAHPAQDQVLMHGGPRVAAGVAADDLPETAQLVGGQVAAADLDLHRGKPLLALAAHV